MRILLLDVEMSLQVGYFYDQWNTNIPAHKIKQPGFMLSASWQWYGQKKVHSVSVLDDKPRFYLRHDDDFHVIRVLRDQIEQADAVVAFNGDNFDMKEINAGLIKNGLTPLKKVVQIDPYKIAKRHFRFKGGNSLRNLCTVLGVKAEKGHVTDEIWIKATEGDTAAIRKVVQYNKKDIPPLLEIWEKLRPFAPSHINMNHFVDGPDVCPCCASPDLRNKGKVYRKLIVRKDWLCLDCGHRFLGKIVGRYKESA